MFNVQNNLVWNDQDSEPLCRECSIVRTTLSRISKIQDHLVANVQYSEQPCRKQAMSIRDMRIRDATAEAEHTMGERATEKERDGGGRMGGGRILPVSLGLSLSPSLSGLYSTSAVASIIHISCLLVIRFHMIMCVCQSGLCIQRYSHICVAYNLLSICAYALKCVYEYCRVVR